MAAAIVMTCRLEALGDEMPSLSVCCIVQNNESLLPRMLRNVEPVADEIVAVDGGSTDSTVQILESHPKVRCLRRPFDSFPSQKNAAIEAAQGDWVLFIDSDELLSDTLSRMLPGLIRNRFLRWYKFPRYWLLSETPPTYVVADKLYPDYQLRLFRNLPFFRYEADRTVHERFPREGRGWGRKLRKGHLIHLAFLTMSRADRERKAASYSGTNPEAHSTNRMYLWEELDHRIGSCSETWTP
jgi:glycosyltransferase involved in cell wall biosynthesis